MCMCLCVGVCVCMYIHVLLRVCVCACVCLFMRTRMHACIHPYMYTCTYWTDYAWAMHWRRERLSAQLTVGRQLALNDSLQVWPRRAGVEGSGKVFVRVCACARMCVCARAHVCVCVCVCAYVSVCV